MLLETADQFGVTHLSYTVNAAATPTPTPTATPTPTPVPTPVITEQPKNRRVNEGQTATFTVTATGDPPLTYQWLKGGVIIDGATESSYTTPATTSADNATRYSVVVTNPGGSVTSNEARLTVLFAPIIIDQPRDVSVRAGRSATFRVTVSGTKPITFQWQKNGTDITGATAPRYVTPPTTADDNGAVFDVTITNSLGTVTSNNATLTVR
jgi:archaellum component FlaG (FlaF/FlaG flagellin family)